MVDEGRWSSERWTRYIRMGRLQMTLFSALTYVCAVVVACDAVDARVDLGMFIGAYAFVFACQMVAHYSGEMHDIISDRLNIHCSRLTGGSRVLVDDDTIDAAASVYLMRFFLAIGVALIAFILPDRTRLITISMITIAHQYSAPPLLLNHHALGELAAALVQNILLPIFAAASQSDAFTNNPFDPRLAHLIWPSALVKFALFLLLNLNDRRPDWLADKATIPVRLGDRATTILYNIVIMAAYLTCIITMPTTAHLIGALSTVPFAIAIAFTLTFRRPYRYDRIVADALLHCTLIMWSILIVTIAPKWAQLDLHVTFAVVILAVRFVKSATSFRAVASMSAVVVTPEAPIVICGGGISGLVIAITLYQLGMAFKLIEKRSPGASTDGADLALWPAAVLILRALGVRPSFWAEQTHVVRSVVMTRMRDSRVVNRVDMSAVVKGTGEQFRLVSRDALVVELRALLPPGAIEYDTTLVAVEEPERVGAPCTLHLQCALESLATESEISARLVVGADGVHSTVRRETLGEDSPTRYCGEMCYRGIVDVAGDNGVTSRDALKTLLASVPDDTMMIAYGSGLRASAGYIGSTRGYWWVKQAAPEGTTVPDLSTWPLPLQVLYGATPEAARYAHAIIDRKQSSARWSTPYSVLVGDAAHPVTPNMGQGACMAIEDAFIVGTGIAEFASQPDGSVEACYAYEQRRRAHTSAIGKSSYIQSKIGQLSHPVLVWLRDNLLYRLPRAIFIGKLRTNNFNVDGDIERFLRFKAINAGA